VARSIAWAVRGASELVTTLRPLPVTSQGPVAGNRGARSWRGGRTATADGLGDLYHVQCVQRDRNMLGRRADSGGVQWRAELVAVQLEGMRFVVQLRLACGACIVCRSNSAMYSELMHNDASSRPAV
jgi:hypothetical protein